MPWKTGIEALNWSSDLCLFRGSNSTIEAGSTFVKPRHDMMQRWSKDYLPSPLLHCTAHEGWWKWTHLNASPVHFDVVQLWGRIGSSQVGVPWFWGFPLNAGHMASERSPFPKSCPFPSPLYDLKSNSADSWEHVACWSVGEPFKFHGGQGEKEKKRGCHGSLTFATCLVSLSRKQQIHHMHSSFHPLPACTGSKGEENAYFHASPSFTVVPRQGSSEREGRLYWHV